MARSSEVRIKSFAELRALWKEDRQVNGGRALEPGFHALAVYRFGVWVDGLRSGALRFPLRRLYFVLNRLVESLYGIRLYYTAEIGRRLQLAHGQCGVVISPKCRIGNDCIIRQNVTLGRRRSQAPSDEVPQLGDRVEIGAGAVLIGPITVGNDTLVGANVVLRKDVPPGSAVLPPDPEIRERRRRGEGGAMPAPDASEPSHSRATRRRPEEPRVAEGRRTATRSLQAFTDRSG